MMAHELFVTYNSPSLFLELLSDYTKATERGLIKVLKIRQVTADQLKLPTLPFMVSLTGEVIHGEVHLSETISKIAGLYETLFGRTQEAVFSHMDFIKNFKNNSKEQKSALTYLNNHLLRNTFCNGSHISISDLFAYSEIIPIVATLSDSDKYTYANIIRWVDHIQNLSGLKEKVREFRLRVALPYEPLFLEAETKQQGEVKKNKNDAKREAKEAFLAKGGQIKDSKPKEKELPKEDGKKSNDKASHSQKSELPIATSTDKKVEKHDEAKKTETKPKQAEDKAAKPQKQQQPKNAPKPKDPLDDAHPVSKLDIRVGKVINIFVNENSEKLYNEEIDLGNGEIRKIASGLKGRVPLEDLKDSFVCILANLKERALCGWPSHGMILCASDEKGNIEPIRPPAGSQPGDKIQIGDFPRTPVAELNPKKSPWEAVQPEMTVNEQNQATYQKTAVWKTEKGEIRTKSVVNAKIS
jgi:aminoacyl tRNA synthase complex-interacting multifunctional protein 1